MVRAAFTHNLGILNTELTKERQNVPEIQARLAIIRKKTSELEEINRKIFKVMVEGDLSEEQLLQETSIELSISK